jgi:hypothetical protein
MIQKPALVLSVALTAFVVFTLSGLVRVFASGSTAGSTASEGAVSAEISPELVQLISDRELAYTEMIDQANQQLEQAQAALAAATAPSAGEQNAVGVQISAQQALEVASGSAIVGAQLAGEPQLVNFEGAVAYEVPFDIGNIYIDATTGELLFNGTVNLLPSPITQEQAAQIAAGYLGRSDIYRIEILQLNGVDVFRVKFLNSDAVFVDLYGQILLVRLAPTGSSSQAGEGSSQGEQHGDDDHDDDD